MPATVTAVLDQPVYAPRQLMTLTITVQAEDPAPVPFTVAGKVVLNTGEELTFTATGATDTETPQLTEVAVLSSGGFRWSVATVTGNVATLTALA